MDDVSGAGDTETIYVTHARICNNRTDRNKTTLFIAAQRNKQTLRSRAT